MAAWTSPASGTFGQASLLPQRTPLRRQTTLACARVPKNVRGTRRRRVQLQLHSVSPDAMDAFAAGIVVGVLAGSVLAGSVLRSIASSFSFGGQAESEQHEKAIGSSLVQAAARGPAGLEAKAKAAYALVQAAASIGVQVYSETGDFSDVARGAAECRQELVDRVVEELQSGRADVASVAEYLVDAALTRAARCAQGGGDIYSELWALDEGRSSVAATSVREQLHSPAVEVGQDLARRMAAKDVLVDEQARGGDQPLRPLFRQVQPHVFARPTALALLKVFEVFRSRRKDGRGDYMPEERRLIEALLVAVNRTPVMRRCRAEAAKLANQRWTDAAWQRLLWQIWFERPLGSHRCGFEHVFVGEASVDLQGREVVGGLHNWFKFYLEEQRGAARYLGRRYPGRIGDTEASMNPRFVSGHFTWDLEGRHLVKDVGGFFVGVSPEWQIAVATTAFFETETAECAVARQWSRDFSMRGEGYMRVVKLGQHIYRLFVCRANSGRLTTFFSSQLGAWDARARAELDQTLEKLELEQKLPAILVLHGFADKPELLKCAARVGSAGAFTLREALQHLRAELGYSFKSLIARDDPGVREVLACDFREVATELVAAHEEGSLTSAQWPDLLQRLQNQLGFSGRRLYRPLRLALTGKLKGHDLRELLQLLELLEAGAPWSQDLIPLNLRVKTVRRWLEDTSDRSAATLVTCNTSTAD